MAVNLLKWLGLPWEKSRDYLKRDLEAIEIALNEPVDLSVAVTGTISFANLPSVPASTLLGRGSAAGSGPLEVITLGSGLIMSGKVLSVNPGLVSQQGGGGFSRSQDGEDGERGPQGLKGDRGDKGDRGQPGQDGEQGDQGPPGMQGATGPAGAGSTGTWTLLTNGDLIEPELVYAGGDVISMFVP